MRTNNATTIWVETTASDDILYGTKP
jgi:hypothetical protein